MAGIRESLVSQWTTLEPLPAPGREFDAFVRQSFDPTHRNPTIDRFGHRYRYALLADPSGRVNGFRIVSAGPDGIMGTKDDIVVSWQAPEPSSLTVEVSEIY